MILLIIIVIIIKNISYRLSHNNNYNSKDTTDIHCVKSNQNPIISYQESNLEESIEVVGFWTNKRKLQWNVN